MAVAAVIGVAVVTGGISANQQHEARNDQKRANNRAQRIEAIKGQRERAAALAQNRVNTAAVTAMGANAGVSGSSGVAGTVASIGTQGASNLSFANQVDQLNAQRLRYLDKAQGHLTRAGQVEQVGSIVQAGITGYSTRKAGG